MNSQASKNEQAARPLSKRIILATFFGLVFTISISLFIISLGEKQRNDLKRDYEVPQSFLARMIALQQVTVGKLMEPGEVIVCAVSSYGHVDAINELNESQKKSTPKDMLPSDDGMWYLIFFSETKSTRIYLIENAAIDGVTTDSDQCAGREGAFNVLRDAQINTPDSDKGLNMYS
jgi:hypothetical protein